MSLKSTPWKLTQDQIDDLGEYCEAHGINKSEAGRIAFARLLAKKPKSEEIEAARRERGTDNLAEYNRRRAEQAGG